MYSFLTVLLLVAGLLTGGDGLEKEIKEAVRYIDKKIVEAPIPENREDLLYIRALKDVRAFLTGEHRDGERALKALFYIKKYSEKRNYKVFPEDKIKQIKLLIEALIRNDTVAKLSASHHRS
ncbi:MAG: hypothetical protein GXN94_03295 [Aquificae bacterium]|nr:hypothetical protein [Aquificota bacterium]